MKPVLFKIQGVNINSLEVFFLLGFIVFIVLAWVNLRQYVKVNKIFDTAVFSLLISVFIGRSVFVFQHITAFSANGWNLLPFRDTDIGVDYFNTLPWNFFAIWDKGVYYNFIPFAIAFSAIIFIGSKKMGNNGERINFIRRHMPLLWLSFIPAYIFVLIGFLLDGSYVGKSSDIPLKVTYEGLNEPRIAIQLIEILVLLISLVFYLDSRSDRKSKLNVEQLRFVFFPLVWTVSEISIWFLTDSHTKKFLFFDEMQITWLLLFFLYLISLLSYFPKKSRHDNEGQATNNKRFKRVYLADLQGKNAKSTNIQQVPQSNQGYSYSFSSYGKHITPQLNRKERFNQLKGKLKRKKL